MYVHLRGTKRFLPVLVHLEMVPVENQKFPKITVLNCIPCLLVRTVDSSQRGQPGKQNQYVSCTILKSPQVRVFVPIFEGAKVLDAFAKYQRVFKFIKKMKNEKSVGPQRGSHPTRRLDSGTKYVDLYHSRSGNDGKLETLNPNIGGHVQVQLSTKLVKSRFTVLFAVLDRTDCTVPSSCYFVAVQNLPPNNP